jgi:replication initiation protein RepC
MPGATLDMGQAEATAETQDRPSEENSDNGPTAGPKDGSRTPPGSGRTDSGTVLRLSIDELMMLAPRLRTYLKSPRPAWPEIVDAADWLRGELGVSKSLWGEACLAMGREQAAIALGIVSAKPETHFRTTPGGYFHGMVMKAKIGDLNLARTVWGLRQAKASRPGHGASWPRPS